MRWAQGRQPRRLAQTNLMIRLMPVKSSLRTCPSPYTSSAIALVDSLTLRLRTLLAPHGSKETEVLVEVCARDFPEEEAASGCATVPLSIYLRNPLSRPLERPTSNTTSLRRTLEAGRGRVGNSVRGRTSDVVRRSRRVRPLGRRTQPSGTPRAGAAVDRCATA